MTTPAQREYAADLRRIAMRVRNTSHSDAADCFDHLADLYWHETFRNRDVPGLDDDPEHYVPTAPRGFVERSYAGSQGAMCAEGRT